MFDAASRYLLFPLKRAVADVLLPHLEMAPPAELCHWLMLADMYDVLNLHYFLFTVVGCPLISELRIKLECKHMRPMIFLSSITVSFFLRYINVSIWPIIEYLSCQSI